MNPNSHEWCDWGNRLVARSDELSNFDVRATRSSGIVGTSSEAMLTIINDILDPSKIEAGRVELPLAPFPIREFIESAIDVIASKAHLKGLEVEYKAESDVPDLINADYKRFTQSCSICCPMQRNSSRKAMYLSKFGFDRARNWLSLRRNSEISGSPTNFRVVFRCPRHWNRNS